jgi:2-C-methyl-D-erythritol 4-phosphate cytidylyltransferase
MDFMINCVKKKINKITFYWQIITHILEMKRILKKCVSDEYTNSDTNVCLLLSAGKSTRFKNQLQYLTSKQTYTYMDKPIILYSLEALIEIETMTHIVVITNTECFDEIDNIINEMVNNLSQKNMGKKCEIVLIVNDIDCRLKTIETGLEYIKNNIKDEIINNVVIHDCARPFVPVEYFKTILSNNEFYSQYSLNLTNGLADSDLNIYDRNNFFELCSPICIKYDLCKFVFENFIYSSNLFVYEPISILKVYGVKINIIYGKYKFLKKITYFDDL